MKNTLLGHYSRFFLITMLILLSSYIYMSRTFQTAVLDQVRSDLYETSMILLPHIPDLDSDSGRVDEFCKQTAGPTDLRLTIVLRDGEVIGDSENTIDDMDNHISRPEIAQALSGNTGFSNRLSTTMGIQFAYLSVPLRNDSGEIVAALRVARAIQDIEDTFTTISNLILTLLVIIIFTSGMFGYYISRRTKYALEKLERAARQIHSGNYTVSVDIDFPGEAQALAGEMSRMAVELQRYITELHNQKSELEAILSSMLEAVILVGRNLEIIRVNSAAADLLEVVAEEVKGKPLISVFRNSALHDFTKKVMNSPIPLEENINYSLRSEILHLQAHGTSIRPGVEYSGSILIVLNDITRIKNLENIRKDFVANVSHELKTPITNIAGFVETLISGALDDPDEARRFLEIVQRHTIRLNSIIDDLLSLSKLEQPDQGDIEFEKTRAGVFLGNAIQICSHKARNRSITINQNIDPELFVDVIPGLIEQAFVNIIDNSVKYSDPDTIVDVTAKAVGEFAQIIVSDHGHGIPRKDMPRIFERFYRVDKARSREMGGTGLGLSIVKHIVRLNRGTIRVSSEVGTGTDVIVDLQLHRET